MNTTPPVAQRVAQQHFRFSPIDTAPKDGTRILGRWLPTYNVTVIWWENRGLMPNGGYWYDGRFSHDGITEWMPIPDDKACAQYATLVDSLAFVLSNETHRMGNKYIEARAALAAVKPPTLLRYYLSAAGYIVDREQDGDAALIARVKECRKQNEYGESVCAQLNGGTDLDEVLKLHEVLIERVQRKD